MKKRFYEKYKQKGIISNKYIFVDKETGVNYLYVGNSYGGGLTPLLNKDGKPFISKENIE